jgi:hypothetical protein
LLASQKGVGLECPTPFLLFRLCRVDFRGIFASTSSSPEYS